MFKLIKTKDDDNEFDHTNVNVTLPHNDITLDDLCEAMTDYIRACGFYIDNKKVAIIPTEDMVDEAARKEELAQVFADAD